MSFGKRGGDQDEPHMRSLLTSKPARHDDETIANMRTKVSARGGGRMDKGFMALALGVVLVSAGGALAAPSVFSMFGTGQVRPVHEIVAGLDAVRAKQALAGEAFPDGEGRAFMASLQQNFPAEHDRLLNGITAAALQGGTRDDLMTEVNNWGMDFLPANFAAIGRTGKKGFDHAIDIGNELIGVVEKTAGGCTMEKLGSFITDPTALAAIGAYGSDGYRFNMKATRTLVDLAAQGKSMPPVDTTFTAQDEEALLTGFIGMMMNEQFVGLIQVAAMNGSTGTFEDELSQKLDICKLGKSVFMRLDKLPHSTKAKIWAMGAQGMDLTRLLGAEPGANGFPGIPGVNAPPPGFPMHLLQDGGLTADS